jgi:hypothetical protein
MPSFVEIVYHPVKKLYRVVLFLFLSWHVQAGCYRLRGEPSYRANSNRPDLIESRWAYHLVPIGLPWLPESLAAAQAYHPVKKLYRVVLFLFLSWHVQAGCYRLRGEPSSLA